MALDDFQQLVSDLIRDDDNRIVREDRTEAINLAVSRYSKDRPLKEVEDVAASGGNYQDIPSKWQDGFSQLQSIEYPVGEVPPSFLQSGHWVMYQSVSGPQIVLSASVTAGDTLRMTYTRMHVVDASQDTIPVIDREPVACYAAAYLCEQLANLYSRDSDSTIQADSVDHASKGRDFSRRAQTLRQRYFNELGINAKRNNASGVVVDFDKTDSQGNDRLFHKGRFR